MREFIQQQPQIPLSQPGTPHEPRRGFFHSFSGLIMTFIILLAILYGGALLLSRTAGFAALVKGRLDKHTGLEFKIGHAALTPSLTLVLEDVECIVPNHPLKARASAGRAVIRWSPMLALFGHDPIRELYAENCDLLFAPDASGRWQPAPFGQVSDWLAKRMNLDLSRYVASARSAATNDGEAIEFDLFAEQRVELKNALIHWQVVADSEIARAAGVNLASSRVQLPNREITHFLLYLTKADTAQGFHAETKRMELLDLGDRESWIEGGPSNLMPVITRPMLKPLAAPKSVPPPAKAASVTRQAETPVEKQIPPPAGSPDPKPEE